MKKSDLVEEVQKTLGGDTTKAHAERAVEAVLQSIQSGLQKDQAVQIPGFGSFTVKERAARTGRNPQTGAEIQIAASNVITFKVGKTLKDSVN